MKLSKHIAITIIFIQTGSSVFSASYFVKNSGDDRNTGQSDEQALAHHPWMVTYKGDVKMAPGDSVFMKRGDIWTYSGPSDAFLVVGNSGTSGDYIVTTAYGTGNKPKLYRDKKIINSKVILADSKAYIIFDNLEIVHHSKLFGSVCSGIFMSERAGLPCHDWIITNCDIHEIPHHCIYAGHDSYNIIIGDTTAKECATKANFSNHIYNFGYSGIMLCGTNPETLISNFKVYYNYIHTSTRKNTGDNAYGIQATLQRNATAWPAYTYVRYNYVEGIKTWHAVGDHGGSYFYLQDNHIANFGKTGFNKLGARISPFSITNHHVFIERNLFEQDPDSVLVNSGGAFIAVSTSSKNTLASNIYIRDNILKYTKRPTKSFLSDTATFGPITIRHADSVFISHNRITNGPLIGTNTAAIATYYIVKNLFIEANYIENWRYGVYITGSTLVGKAKITNNIINGGGIAISGSSLSSGAYVEIYHNSFVNLLFGAGTESGSTVVVKNNLIGDPIHRLNWYYIFAHPSSSIQGTLIIDNNVYAKSSLAKPYCFNGAFYSFNQWQGLGQDVNSTEKTDLKLRKQNNNLNEPLSFDFKLTSPLYNSGSDIGVEYDYFGLKRKGNPDIGPIEYRNFRFF